jgi:hypothetical protein
MNDISTIDLWNLIIGSVSTLLSAVAIFLYIILWMREKSDNNYEVFDSTYLEILKTGIEYPNFRNGEFTSDYKSHSNTEEIIRYEIYAFICWNFCETLYDKGDEELMKTWSVVIDTENNLHRSWFNQPENAPKFKDEFRDFIFKKYPMI